MVSDDYYLVVGMEFIISEKKIFDRRNNNEEIDITSFKGKKKIFEREVKEWLLHPMEKLLEEDIDEFSGEYKYRPFRNSIFILFGLFAYIEKMELYRGNGLPNDRRSTQRLVDGVKRIFANLSNRYDNDIREILKRSRHNLMHQAMIEDDILVNLGLMQNESGDVNLNNNLFGEAIDIVSENGEQEIRINSIRMYDKITEDFDNYLTEIESEGELRTFFTTFFDNVYAAEIEIINS